MPVETETTVLVVEDEPDLIDLYQDYLADTYRVRTATDGAAAMEQLDACIDVVLLDRRMPDTDGDTVLGQIEASGFDPRIALVTAVAPDLDILDLLLDDYLVKPVTQAEVRDTVERLVLIDEYSERRRQLNALEVKRNVLQVEKSPAELERNRAYRELVAEIEALESRVAALTDSLEGTPLTQYS